jgi:hypothetical protein
MIPLNIVYDDSTHEATLFIDNSGLEKFDVCQRSAEYYLCRRRESNKEKPALQFGKIIHKILEARYSRADVDVLSQFDKLVAVATAEFSKWTPPDGDYRNFAMAVDVISEYAAIYPFETFDLATFNGQPAVELPFACPLGTIDVEAEVAILNPDGSSRIVYLSKLHIVVKGKIDLLIRREGRLYVMDHKTTSMMGPTYFNDFQISGQVYTYAWAAKELTGEEPHGFMVNALGVRAPTKSGKKLEFKRHTVTLYKELIEEWKKDVMYKVADFVEMARRGYFPKQTKWCAGKYGMCEYHGVCTLSSDMRDVALSTNEFKDVTWDPLKQEE